MRTRDEERLQVCMCMSTQGVSLQSAAHDGRARRERVMNRLPGWHNPVRCNQANHCSSSTCWREGRWSQAHSATPTQTNLASHKSQVTAGPRTGPAECRHRKKRHGERVLRDRATSSACSDDRRKHSVGVPEAPRTWVQVPGLVKPWPRPLPVLSPPSLLAIGPTVEHIRSHTVRIRTLL